MNTCPALPVNVATAPIRLTIYAADRDLGYPACLEDGYPASLALTYADDHLWTLPVGERGLRCYAVRSPYRFFPTLGEGDKPLVLLPDLAEELDLEALWPKNKGANPASRGFVLVKNGWFSQKLEDVSPYAAIRSTSERMTDDFI